MGITGKDLIDLGFPPGEALGRALAFTKAYFSIMAGDWQRDAPRRRIKAATP